MRPFFIILTIILCSGVRIVHAGLADDYIEQARQAQLGQHPAWLALLHYKEEVLTGQFISQADDDLFFRSAQGKADPQAELEADLKAFLMPAGIDHSQCFLPARWHWLKQQLGISSQYDVSCPKLKAWMDSVSTDRLTLVFPAMYLNNPGSAFGHTFLRFDSPGSIMLSQTINYAAAYDA